jgi:hypothetical protein
VSKVDQMIAAATAQLGKPYVFGDAGPNAFDCSGLTEYAAAAAGVSLPHNAAQQQKTTSRVTSPLPGDLVFFGDPAYHVGLYVGNGQMITAPHSGATVHITAVGTPTNYGRITGLGTATAPAVSTVADGVSVVGAALSDWLGGARGVVLEVAFVGLGVGLLAYGLYRGVAAPARHRMDAQIEELL